MPRDDDYNDDEEEEEEDDFQIDGFRCSDVDVDVDGGRSDVRKFGRSDVRTFGPSDIRTFGSLCEGILVI